MNSNKKGFTLIELLAVIVILAIIALIATPLVMSTIKKAREGAAISSGTAFVKIVENAVAQNQMEAEPITLPTTTPFTAPPTGLTFEGKNIPAEYEISLTADGSVANESTMKVNGINLVVTDGKVVKES